MIIALRGIVEVFSGHTVRGRVENDPSGDVFVIQLKDLAKHYSEISDSKLSIKSSEVPRNQFLQKGDVLFVSKGANNFAVVFEKEYPAVAVSVFFVLRITDKKIDPHYLAWYINQEKAQSYLHTGKEGTMITNINKVTLENLEIEIPSKEKQKLIAEINTLWNQERHLTNQIISKRNSLIKSFTQKIIRHEK